MPASTGCSRGVCSTLPWDSISAASPSVFIEKRDAKKLRRSPAARNRARIRSASKKARPKAGGKCGLAPPAQQKNGLFAEKVPERPRHLQPDAPAPGIKRHRLLDLGAGDAAELAKILDAAEMNVRRFVPRIRQVIGMRHV